MSFALLLVVAALLAGCPAFAERLPYDHYRSIVDRQMFGPLPDDFDPTKLPSEAKSSQKRGKQAENLTKEQEKLKSAIRFSVINVTPGGAVKVGFTDSSDKKAPRNYYLGVGETRDGWVVKEADPDAATMTVEKDEVEITLTIGGDSAKSDGATKKAGASVAAPDASGAGSRRSGLLGLNKTLNRKLTRKEERQKSAEEIERIRKEAAAREAEQEAARKKEREEFVAGQEAMRQDLARLQQQIQADRQKTEEAAKRNANTEGESDEDNDVE